jgi:hypothetical protein
MQKLFCDSCGKEIARKNGVRTYHEIEFTRCEERADDSIGADTTLKVEVCGPCRLKIGPLVTRELKRNK